jgi:sugar phosphate isomerase/epimerase
MGRCLPARCGDVILTQRNLANNRILGANHISGEHIMKRRQFLQTAAGAITAGATAMRASSLSAADEPPFRLHYVLASPMYGTMPLDVVLSEVAATGAQCIDIWPRRHADHREQVEAMGHDRFAELLERHSVRLGMITRYDLGPYALGDELPVIEKFGGKLVVTGAGRGSGETVKQRVRNFVASMEPHVEAAAERGITIGIENHGHSLIDTPDSLRWFAEFSAHPNLGIALAPYHLPQDEQLLARLIEDLGPKLVHFYAWQHGMGCMEKLPKQQEMLQMPGRGDLDFTALLGALKTIDFCGWTEVFMHPVPRGIPILPTAREVTEAINEARGYLQTCLDQISAG